MWYNEKQKLHVLRFPGNIFTFDEFWRGNFHDEIDFFHHQKNLCIYRFLVSKQSACGIWCGGSWFAWKYLENSFFFANSLIKTFAWHIGSIFNLALSLVMLVEYVKNCLTVGFCMRITLLGWIFMEICKFLFSHLF